MQNRVAVSTTRGSIVIVNSDIVIHHVNHTLEHNEIFDPVNGRDASVKYTYTCGE